MGSFGKQRIWNPNDSEDPSDTRRLYEADPPKTLKRGRCISTWTFSLLILAASVLFLMGLFIGYYVRESQSGPTNDSCNGVMQRKDSFDPQKLESIHKNHMNFLSSENVRRYIREFSTGEPELTNTHWDKTVVNHIRSEFNKFGLDKVDIQNHNIVVTYPDPERPNHLEIINSSGNVELNVSLGSIERDQDQPVFQSPQNDSMTNRVLYPYVAFSPPGVVKGGIVYGHYGHSTDFLHLWESGVETNGRVLLLRLGHTSVGEKMKLSAEAVRIPYASAGDSDQPVIPAQTVSMGIAQDLFKRMSGPAAPAGWQGGFEDLTYRIHPSATDPWEVRMAVYNKQDTAQITNVIGSIHGDSEPDRYVLIGASRTAFPSDASDTKTNTAVLMEIAHQLSEIQEVDGWSPRRGVRLCSWGGSELSQAGLRRYIEEKKNILMQKAVAYIDLDRLVEGIDFVQFTAANSMVDLIMKAANKVPDANDPTNAVSELWLSRADDYSLINYYDDYPEQFPFLHSIGVPVLKVQYKGRELQTDAKNIREILNHDSQHHFKYHLTAARVASLMLLELVDDIQLPFNLMIYTLKYTTSCRQYNIISEDAAALARAGGAYQDFVTSFKNIFDILSLRKTNDLLMIFDKFFLAELPEKKHWIQENMPILMESRTQHMLFRPDKAGAILLFTESAESSTSGTSWQTTAHLLEKTEDGTAGGSWQHHESNSFVVVTLNVFLLLLNQYTCSTDSDQPVIPAQTVSMGIAQDLFKRMSGPAAPAGWQGGFEDLTYRIHPSATDPWEVRMAVYNKQDTAQITNVIGSIHGDSEPDRYVLIGASRTAFPSDASDTKTNTAVLMEIAHQLSEIQEVDGWSPRRGVRLCSWGGSELSQAGLRRYIEEKKNILMQKAVAYIDLDRLVEGIDFVQFTAANSMVDLIMKAANKVPDANDPTNAVSELWLSRADDYSLINYYDDYPEQFPFLHSIGVPVLKVQYKGRELQTDAKNIREILNHDSQHHFKYHLTAARVASLMLLELVDDIQLPFNLMIYTLKIQQAVDSTVRILRKYPALDQKLLDIISEDAAALARAGGAYQDFVTSFKNIFDILSLRKTNDLLMIFDKFFLAELPEKSIGYKKTCPSLWESRTQHMLFRQDKAGAILLFTESAESSNFRNEWQTTAHLLEKLKTALQEAHSSLLSEDP
ncbi:hypothetical protein ScPMuIL_017483 [Solemya velum]